MEREELGKIARSAWIEWAQTQPGAPPLRTQWQDIDESIKECDRLIGERIQDAVLSDIYEQFEGKLVKVSGNGYKVMMNVQEVTRLFKFLDDNKPKQQIEKSHFRNLPSTLEAIVNNLKLSEKTLAIEINLFSKEVCNELMSCADLITEIANTKAYEEKQSLLQKLEQLIYNLGEKVTRWGGDIPRVDCLSLKAKQYLQIIQELEQEIKELKLSEKFTNFSM